MTLLGTGPDPSFGGGVRVSRTDEQGSCPHLEHGLVHEQAEHAVW